MQLLGYSGWYPGWLLRCCYAVARVPRWLPRCCYDAVAMVPGVVARVLLGYTGWLLWCC